jgi:plasmid stabilization system protein ParE
MTRLSLLGNAKADFDTAFGWYCERSEAAAIRFMEATVESLTAAIAGSTPVRAT